MLKTILAATDFSPAAVAAVQQAARIAGETGAALHILHVPSMNAVNELAAFFPDTAEFGLADAIKAVTERIAERLKNFDAPENTNILVRPGNTNKEIATAIEQLKPDLLVIGSTGEAGRKLGTIGGKCVRKANCNVLLVPADQEGPFKHITACVDFSELSPAVIRAAAEVSKHEDASVTAVYAHEKVDHSVFVKGPPQELIDKLPGIIANRFDEQLRPHAEGVDISFTMTTCRSYDKGIVQFANDSETDLVVTGTTGRSGLAYMLLGTTAEKVIRDVGCAVLAIKLKLA